MNGVSSKVGVKVKADGSVSARVALDIGHGGSAAADARVWRDEEGSVQVTAEAAVLPAVAPRPLAHGSRSASHAKAGWHNRWRTHLAKLDRQWWEEDLRPFSLLGVLRDVARTALIFVVAFVLLGVYAAVVHPGYLRDEPLPRELYEHLNGFFSVEALTIELTVAGVILCGLACIPVLRRHIRVVADHVVTVLCTTGAFYGVFMAFGRAYHIPNAAPVGTILCVSGMLFAMALVCNGAIALLSDTINEGARKKHLRP